MIFYDIQTIFTLQLAYLVEITQLYCICTVFIMDPQFCLQDKIHPNKCQPPNPHTYRVVVFLFKCKKPHLHGPTTFPNAFTGSSQPYGIDCFPQDADTM